LPLLVFLAIALFGAGQIPAAACGVTVDIRMGGQSIKNKTQDTIVGRQINLEGVVSGGTPTSKSWSIPQKRIKNYTASSASATVTDLTENDLSQSTVAFYWVDGGNGRTVTYTVTVNGQVYPASTTFNVKRPTSTLTSTTGSVTISNSWDGLEMCYGVPGTPAISFSRTYSEPPAFSGGTCTWVQVVASTTRRRLSNGDVWWRKSGTNLCDTTYPYPGGASTDDSPGEGLRGDYKRVVVSQNETFSMYLMYTPVGGGIPVPLRKVDWYWYGDTSRDGANWTLDSSGNNSNPASGDCTTHPTWSANVTSLTWQQE
jgi:hypothetical protein